MKEHLVYGIRASLVCERLELKKMIRFKGKSAALSPHKTIQ